MATNKKPPAHKRPTTPAADAPAEKYTPIDQDDSLFVSEAVIKRPVTLGDGKKHTMYFKEAPASVFRRFQIAEHSADDDVRVTSMFQLIVASVCEPDGRRALTLEKAMLLKPNVTNALVKEILAINQMGAAAKNA